MIEFQPVAAPEIGVKILETGIASDLSLKGALSIRLVTALIDRGYIVEKDRAKFEVCFEEAIVNAIVHGNRQDPSKFVSVRLYSDGDQWRAHISDQGPGFSPSSISDPDDPEYVWAESGRGIHMIEHLAGTLEYYDSGRTAVMVGNRSEDARPVPPAPIAGRVSDVSGAWVAQVLPESSGEEVTVQIDRIAATLEKESPSFAVIDLTHTPHLASTGIGSLVRFYKTCLRVGARFAVVGAAEGLREMFTMMQLDRLFPVHDTVEEAVREFESQS